MSAIYLTELTDALGCSAMGGLTADGTESGNIKGVIDEFVADPRLQGSAWDSVRAKLSEFSAAFEARMNLVSNLSAAINEALNLLIEYMGEDKYLNPEDLETIRATCESSKTTLATIGGLLASTTVYTDPETGEESSVYVVADQGTRDALAAKMGELSEAIPEMERLIAKLEQFQEVYDKAVAILDAAFAEVDAFGTMVADIIPSEKVQYVPVG